MEFATLQSLIRTIGFGGIIASDLLALFWLVIYLYGAGFHDYILQEVHAYYKVWLSALVLGAFLFFPVTAWFQVPYLSGPLYIGLAIFLGGLLRESVKFTAAYLSLGFAPDEEPLSPLFYVFPGIMAGAGFAGMEGWVVLSAVLNFPELTVSTLILTLLQRFFVFSFQVTFPAIILYWWQRKRGRGPLALFISSVLSGALYYLLPLSLQLEALIIPRPFFFAVLLGLAAPLYLTRLLK